jgi:hypothetical protein
VTVVGQRVGTGVAHWNGAALSALMRITNIEASLCDGQRGAFFALAADPGPS